MRKTKISEAFKQLQSKICLSLELADGKGLFKIDNWTKDIGYGLTNVMINADAIEKAAVNYSVVSGKLSENMQKVLQLKTEEKYFATGISSIIHPKNPHVPIIHMNVRYFQLDSGQAWFGGGIDLTPHYVNKSEAKWFHQELKALCDKYDLQYYKNYKEQADEYFYLPHRDETRGIGGIFFDHQDASSSDQFDHFLNFTSH
jgi:coproporphyrinogen III oxidase